MVVVMMIMMVLISADESSGDGVYEEVIVW